MRWRKARVVVRQTRQADVLLLSYHGIPQRYADEGDDRRSAVSRYHARTGFRIGAAAGKVMMTFQSRFGREPWLTPYTDEGLAKMLGERGDWPYSGHVSGVCPPGLSGDAGERWRNRDEIFMKRAVKSMRTFRR